MKKYCIIAILAFGIFSLPRFSHAAIIFDNRIPTSSQFQINVGSAASSGFLGWVQISSPLGQYTGTTIASGTTLYWGGSIGDTGTHSDYLSQSASSSDYSVSFAMDTGQPFTAPATTTNGFVTGTLVSGLSNGAFIWLTTDSGQSQYAATGTYVGPSVGGFQYGNYLGKADFCLATDAVSCNAPYVPPITSPQLNFQYPESGSTTPPFSPWILTVTNLVASDTYGASVHWYMTNHIAVTQNLVGLSFALQGQSFAPIFGDTLNGFSGASGTIAIPKPNRDLYPTTIVVPANDDTWHATAYLTDLTTGSLVVSSSIDFTMQRYGAVFDGLIGLNGTTTYVTPIVNASGTVTVTTSTSLYSGNQPSSAPSSTANCPGAASFTDVGGGVRYGLCVTMYALFDPNTIPGGQEYFQTQLTTLKGIPLFSTIFTTLDTVSSSANAYQNATTTSLSITLGEDSQFGPNPTLVTFNSSTFYSLAASTTVARNNVAFVNGYVVMWIWIFATAKLWYIFTAA